MDVLISIQSKWCEKIISGEKTVEVRKSRPARATPFKAFIYCTVGNPTLNIPVSDKRLHADLLVNGMQSMNCPMGNGKIIGEFICDGIQDITYADDGNHQWYQWLDAPSWAFFLPRVACLTDEQLAAYFCGRDGYGWHISKLKIYDEPINLCELFEPGAEWSRITRPPQSWRYVEGPI